MSYNMELIGTLNIDPPLSKEEVKYINRFNITRHMLTTKGPYTVDTEYVDYITKPIPEHIINFNEYASGHPKSYWCNWFVSDDGTQLGWDGRPNFLLFKEWLDYLITHFLGKDPIAARVEPEQFSFLSGDHILNGVIKVYPETTDSEELIENTYILLVKNNKASILSLSDYENNQSKDNNSTFSINKILKSAIRR